MKAKGWPLDYGWGYEGGWDVGSDVCLEARLRGADIAPAVARAQAWLDGKKVDEVLIDGAPRKVFLAGACIFYLEEDAECASVFMHSHGEDAFDSLAYYAEEFAAALNGCAADARLDWVQHAHDRDHHRMKAA